MSATSNQTTPDASPIQPLHRPDQAARVVPPQAPLGNATNQTHAPPGMGGKALLAKKLSQSNPTYVSPSDQLMTPCTAKLNQVKQKRFNVKAAKPIRFGFNATGETEEAAPMPASASGPSTAQDTEQGGDDSMEQDKAATMTEVAAAPVAPTQSRLQPAEL